MSAELDHWDAVADIAAARVAAWIATLADDPGSSATASLVGDDAHAAFRSDLIEGSRKDSDSFGFTRRLLDAVVGASDPFNAALGLREVSRDLPQSMPVVERIALRAGGLASLGLPWAVLPVARKWLRDRVSHLVISAKVSGTATDELPALTAALQQAEREKRRVLISLGGTPVLGEHAVQREVDRLLALIERPELRELAVDVARIAPETQAGAWALDDDAEAGAKRLRTVLLAANTHHTSIVLESHDYRSALLAPQLLAKALSGSELQQLRVGVMLPAELPESVQVAEALSAFAQSRHAAGGAPLELVVGVAGFAGKEQIDSVLSGLAVSTIEDRTGQHAQLVRVLLPLLRAGDGVRVVVESEDPHLLSAATVLAEKLGRKDSLTLQLRAGIAPQLEAVIADHGFSVRRRLLLVHPKEFAGAVEYLIALSAETADPDSVLAHTRALFAGEQDALAFGAGELREILTQAAEAPPYSRRVQHREREWSEAARDTVAYYRAPAESRRFETGGLTAAVLGLTRANTGAITLEVMGAPLRIPVISETGFANEPDTDASRFENREWVRAALERAALSGVAIQEVRAAVLAAEHPEVMIDAALAAGEQWGSVRAKDRGTRVARLALGVAAARDRMIEVLAAESGAPVAVIDGEVNATIDAARYLGQLAGALGAVRGAQFHPDRLAVVVADAGVPLGERAEAVLAALAAGSAVLVVAHQSVARSTAVLIEEWNAAGLPEGLVTLAVAATSDDSQAAHLALAQRFTVDSRCERAIVLGSRELARALLKRRPDLRIEGRFRALGVLAVTASADPALAASHVVASAFGAMHADPTTAKALVLLSPASRSERLQSALVDAVSSVQPGDTARPGERDPLSFTLGPLPSLPSAAGLRALTELAQGEEWLVQPEQLDDEGLLWRPGIRTGLLRDAQFWQDAIGMPVIGIINAHSVDEMIALTNRLGGGGVAGLQSNDRSEMLPWLERAEAARIVVGRPTTGGRVERQPGGGWHLAGMGAPALAGGPHRLQSLGTWELREGTASATLHLRGLAPEVRALIEIAQSSLDYQHFDRVRRAALSDALAWRTAFGRAYDVSGLGIERNLLRHWRVSTHVRLAEGADLGDLVRVISAGLVAGAPMTVSTGVVLPANVGEFLALEGISVALERDDDWLERMAVNGPGDEELAASRIRLIGGDRVRTAEWLSGLSEVGLWADPVTMAGPVELLAFVREQSISIAAHRHGLALLPAGIGGWLAEVQGREG